MTGKGENMKAVKVTGVHPDGVEEVYNMEVEDTHCFAVNGGLIVHNCMDATRYFVQTMNLVRQKEQYTPLWNAGIVR